jgi:hypothetical protein
MKKLLSTIRRKARDTGIKASAALTDIRGEVATSTIGGIIIGVVIVGLLIVAINQFFPDFFSGMFEKMSQKLNANW